MPSLSEKDRANLEAGLDAIRKIEVFTADTKDADEFCGLVDAVFEHFVIDLAKELVQLAKIRSFHVPMEELGLDHVGILCGQ